MTDGTSEEAPVPQRLTIKGWHGENVAEILVALPNDVACARRIIAAEANFIAKRSKEIETTLDKQDQNSAAFQASKTRPSFDLEICNIPNTPLGEWRRQFQIEREAARHWFVPRNKSLVEWLVERYVAGGVFAAVGPIDELDTSFLNVGGFGLEVVGPGGGAPAYSVSGNPDRYRPEDGSFAQWLTTMPLGARTRFIGYIFGKATTELDCRLLARRLQRGQIVCALPDTVAAEYLRSAWDGEVFEWPHIIVFARPGLKYLDPVLLTPEEVAQIKWPKVSVVTVSFNQQQFLQQCLDSVLGQDYPNLEYIVVDAGSTDGSIEILKAYESRVSKLIIEPDRGQSDGLNKGFSHATGDVLTWINSDDMLAPGALRRGVLAMLDLDSDLVAGGCQRITEKLGEVLFDHHPALPYGRAVPLGFLEHFMWSMSWEKGDYFFQPEVLFSAEIWRRSGGFLKLHLYWAMDWELWIRMALAGATIGHIPEIIGNSRAHPDQKTLADERYVYQLLNILLEYDDALALLPNDLAPPARKAALPGWLRLAGSGQVMPLRRARADLKTRLLSLRNPTVLRNAIANRMPERIVRWWDARQKAKQGSMSGYVLVHRTKHAQLLHSQRTLSEVIDWMGADGYHKGIADFGMKFLFGDVKVALVAEDIARNNTEIGGTPRDAIRSLAIHFPDLQTRPEFSKVRSFLREGIALAPDLGSDIDAGRYTIVDVGAEALAFESHIYAELTKRRPSLVIGFDPMDKEAPRSVHTVGKGDLPDSEVRIFPSFILDGNPAVFNLARMQATSSTLRVNTNLAERFSLLAEALSTVETHSVETHRLDDTLRAQDLGGCAIDFLKIDVQGATLPVLLGARDTLQRTLVCQVEAEFSELYKSEALFSTIDQHMREAGFDLLDLATLGQQRYKAFDSCKERFFHTGRILWADCVYVRHLDAPERLSDAELLKLAEIAHLVYKKYDVAAFALRELSTRRDATYFNDYLAQWA